METTHYLVYRVVVAWELLSLPSSGFANVAMRRSSKGCEQLQGSISALVSAMFGTKSVHRVYGSK